MARSQRTVSNPALGTRHCRYSVSSAHQKKSSRGTPALFDDFPRDQDAAPTMGVVALTRGTVDHGTEPHLARIRVGEELLEGIGRRDAVVVHQPRPLEGRSRELLEAACIAARRAEVSLQPEELRPVVTCYDIVDWGFTRVVDDQDGRRACGLRGDRVKAAFERASRVVGEHNRLHCIRTHDENSRRARDAWRFPVGRCSCVEREHGTSYAGMQRAVEVPPDVEAASTLLRRPRIRSDRPELARGSSPHNGSDMNTGDNIRSSSCKSACLQKILEQR